MNFVFQAAQRCHVWYYLPWHLVETCTCSHATEVSCFPCKAASKKARRPATFAACLSLTGLNLGLKRVVDKIRSSGKVLSKVRVGIVTVRDVISWLTCREEVSLFFLLHLLAALFLHTNFLPQQAYWRCGQPVPFCTSSVALIFRQIPVCLCFQSKLFGDIPQDCFHLGPWVSNSPQLLRCQVSDCSIS